jgi:predicted ribosomally synthesized peptide with nif11-like leader
MSKVSEVYEALSKDEAMQERAQVLDSAKEEAGKAVSEAIAAFAKDEGYTFTADELDDFMNSNTLSEEELKAVAGGVYDDIAYHQQRMEKEYVICGYVTAVHYRAFTCGLKGWSTDLFVVRSDA